MDLCQWVVKVLLITALVKHCDIIYLWWFAAEFGTSNILLNAVVSLLFCNSEKTCILNPNQLWMLNYCLLLFFLAPGLYLKIKAFFCTSGFLVSQVKISSILRAFGPLLENYSFYFCDADCDNDVHNGVHDLQMD